MAFIAHNIRSITGLLARTASVLAPPLLRIALAVPFFKSGLTKWAGFLVLSPTATFLFSDEFKLHIFGQAYSFPAPAVFAWIDGIAEIVLPILLVIGFATRFSALGLLVMIGVIQLVVPDGWANFHLPWAALAVAIIALGPGPLSLDNLVARVGAKLEE
jgi:putative oxidoreductase